MKILEFFSIFMGLPSWTRIRSESGSTTLLSKKSLQICLSYNIPLLYPGYILSGLRIRSSLITRFQRKGEEVYSWKEYKIFSSSKNAISYTNPLEYILLWTYNECCGSVTLGTDPHPYHWLTDPDPDPAFSSVADKMPTKFCFFQYFFA